MSLSTQRRKRRRHPCTYQHNVCRHKTDCWHIDVDAAICTYWLTTSCKKGEACEYAHSKDEEKLRKWWKRRFVPEDNIDKDRTWSRELNLEILIPIRALLSSEKPQFIINVDRLPLWSTTTPFIMNNYNHNHDDEIILLVVEKLSFLSIENNKINKIKLSMPNEPEIEIPTFILSLALRAFEFTDEFYFGYLISFLNSICINFVNFLSKIHETNQYTDQSIAHPSDIICCLKDSITKVISIPAVCDAVNSSFEGVFQPDNDINNFLESSDLPNDLCAPFIPSAGMDESTCLYNKRRGKVVKGLLNLLTGHVAVPIVRLLFPSFEIFGKEGIVFLHRKFVDKALTNLNQQIPRYGVPQVVQQFMRLLSREGLTNGDIVQFCNSLKTTVGSMFTTPHWSVSLVKTVVSQFIPETSPSSELVGLDITSILYNGIVMVLTCDKSKPEIPKTISQRISNELLSGPPVGELPYGPQLYVESDMILQSDTKLIFSAQKRPVPNYQNHTSEGIHPSLMSEFMYTIGRYPQMKLDSEDGFLSMVSLSGDPQKMDHPGIELQRVMLRAISQNDIMPPTVVSVNLGCAMAGVGLRTGDLYYLKEKIPYIDIEGLEILKQEPTLNILGSLAIKDGRERPVLGSLAPHRWLSRVFYTAFVYCKVSDLIHSSLENTQRAIVTIINAIPAVVVVLTGGEAAERLRTCTALAELLTKPTFLGGLAEVSTNYKKANFSEPTSFYPGTRLPKPVKPVATVGGYFDIDTNFEVFCPVRNPPRPLHGNGPTSGLYYLERELSVGGTITLNRNVNSELSVHSNLFQLVLICWKLIQRELFNVGLIRNTVVKISDIFNRHLMTSPLETSCFKTISIASCKLVLESWSKRNNNLIKMINDMIDDDDSNACESCKLILEL